MGAGASTSRPTTDAPKVAIVGGGYGGIKLAQQLQDVAHVVVFDRKEFAYHNIAAPRAVVHDVANRLLIPFTRALRNGLVLKAPVTRVTRAGEVHADGFSRPMQFDFVVVATGSANTFPAKEPPETVEEMRDLLARYQRAVEGASSIVIVGGGPVGCEAAGEIATEFPSKRITLVHAGERLLTGRVKPELSERVLRLLREKRVNVLLGQRATVGAVPFGGAAFVDEATTVRTSGSDEELPADMVILATGGKVNSACYQVDFGAQMDELERLKVNEHLQVEGNDKVFAIGDVASTVEEGMAYFAERQAGHVAQVIRALAAARTSGQPPRLPNRYEQSRPAMFVASGRNDGAAQVPNAKGSILGGFWVRNIKSKHMFVGKRWQAYGFSKAEADRTARAVAADDKPPSRLFKSQPLSDAELDRWGGLLMVTTGELQEVLGQADR